MASEPQQCIRAIDIQEMHAECPTDFIIVPSLTPEQQEQLAQLRNTLDPDVWNIDMNDPATIEYLEKSHAIWPHDRVNMYNLACEYSVRNEKEKALDMLENAIKHGFFRELWMKILFKLEII